LGTIEAVFMRGVIEYCIATGKYIILDMKGLKTAETATEAYFTIKNEIVDRTLLIDDNTIGTNSEDFSFIVSKKAKMGLLRAHMRDSGTETTHATLATGVLYNNSVLGTMVQEHFFLDQKLPKGKINKDLDFDFSGVQGLVIHNQAVANPKG
jgi:flavin-dependent dehydrogenase